MDTELLREIALDEDPYRSAKAIGMLFAFIHDPMTRDEIEGILGPAPGDGERSNGTTYIVYYCHREGRPDMEVMSIHFEYRNNVQWFTHIEGPHFPE